jgi:methyl-accepting chemotaxis protein
VPVRPTVVEKWTRFDAWRRDVMAELVVLPETLRQFREGVASFQTVGRRLADTTEAMERMNQLYANGVAETTRRLGDASLALHEQMRKTPPGKAAAEAVASAVEDLNRTVAAMASLNPFWPKPKAQPPKE